MAENEVWARVLATVAERVGLGVLETWFRPLVLAGWAETTSEQIVRNAV